MNGEQMRVALDVLAPFAPVTVTAEHDQIWLHSDSFEYEELECEEDPDGDVQYGDPEAQNWLDPHPVDVDEAERMRAAGWFIDTEAGAWTHFC